MLFLVVFCLFLVETSTNLNNFSECKQFPSIPLAYMIMCWQFPKDMYSELLVWSYNQQPVRDALIYETFQRQKYWDIIGIEEGTEKTHKLPRGATGQVWSESKVFHGLPPAQFKVLWPPCSRLIRKTLGWYLLSFLLQLGPSLTLLIIPLLTCHSGCSSLSASWWIAL